MANSRSARKRIRSNERKHIRNRAVRSAVRTSITKARRSLLGSLPTIDSEEQVGGYPVRPMTRRALVIPEGEAARQQWLDRLAKELE